MAIAGLYANQTYLRTTATWNHNAAYSVCGWFYRTANPADYQSLFWVQPTSSGYDNSDGCSIADSTRFGFGEVTVSAVSTSNTASTVNALSTWYFVCMQRNSVTSLTTYWNNVLQTTVTSGTVAGRPAQGEMLIGAWRNPGNEWLEGRCHNIMVYDHALSSDERAAQQVRLLPVTTGLLHWWPLTTITDLANRAGSGAMTLQHSSGSLYSTTDDGSPTPYGAKLQPTYDPRYAYAYPKQDIRRKNWVPVP